MKIDGPDATPVDMVKLAVETRPNFMLGAMNEALLEAKSPTNWKSARLVLMEKELKSSEGI